MKGLKGYKMNNEDDESGSMKNKPMTQPGFLNKIQIVKKILKFSS